MNSIPQSTHRREQSFPLISVIQLATLTIAMITCINGPKLLFVLANLSGDDYLALTTIATAGFFGMIIGAAIGLGHIRKWRSMLFCGVVGSAAGFLILAIYVAPANPAQAITAAILPLVTTLAIRFRSA